MGVLVAMLRGVNVTGNHMIRMEQLRLLCGSLGCSDVQTYVQSGNVVFRSAVKPDALKKKLEDAIDKEFGFRVPVVLRTAPELRMVVEDNPFLKYAQEAPGKLLVHFLCDDPGDARRELVRAMPIAPEELRLVGREIYCWYPEGQGKSKLRWAPIDKVLGTAWTARNWNTVTKLLGMAEAM